MPRTLAGQRLVLRPPVRADAPAVFAFTGDSRVTRYLDWSTHDDCADTRAFLDDVAEGWRSGDDYCWVVTLADTRRVVGSVGCQFDAHGAEIGFVLARDVWVRGLATEAAGLVLDAALEIDAIHRFWPVCDIDNVACVRVLEKIGMQREGVLRRYSERPNLDPGGPPRDVYAYAWVR